jgi:hypothetical protein
MSKLLAVAARELRERWLLFPAGFVLGFVPLVLPAFGVRRDDSGFVGVFGALCLGAAAAVVIGSSMLARDAANGRLGFLFSRPVSWPAIWGGKWLAAVVLVVSSGLLAAVPWMAVYSPQPHGGSWLRAMLDGPGAAFCLMLILLVVGIANFSATAFRSRSPWLVLDFALLLASLWAVRHWVAPLWLYGILGRSLWANVLAPVPLVLGLLVGSAAQVAVGRTDLRRAHRAMSLGFWAVAALALASAGGYWQWVRSAGPAEVDVHAVTRDSGGRWIYVEGTASRSGWYPHGFLIDTTSGRYVVPPESPELQPERLRFGLGMLFSADGRSAARLWADGRGTALGLFDLSGGTPRYSEVALESSPPPTWGSAFALSPATASVFLVHESGASLFALPSGRRVATTTIPPGWHPSAVRFPSEGSARAWLIPSSASGAMRPRGEMLVVDLAADGKSTIIPFPTAGPLSNGGWGAVVPDAGGERIVTVDGGLHLRDGATGELRATLAETQGGWGRLSVLFLADGRIVTSGANQPAPAPPRALVRVFSDAGAPLGETPVDLWPSGITIGPEVAPGRVVVSSFRAPFLPEDTLLADVGERRVVERIPGLRPAIGFWNVSAAVPAGAVVPSVHFFRDAEGRVIRIDFATGERRVVAGPGAPRGGRLSLHSRQAPPEIGQVQIAGSQVRGGRQP